MNLSRRNFSTGLRAKGNLLSTAANWLGNFEVAMIALVLYFLDLYFVCWFQRSVYSHGLILVP